ncbi:MAG: cation diffusion facilitator family transporter [Thermodesulfobacteriota bacterium]
MSPTPARYAQYSILASLVTLALKFGAWALTGSVGLLSDAVESVVNLSASLLALWALTLAHKPADETHAYGHGKAEYFSSGAEGLLIIVAAVGIALASLDRFLHPAPLANLGPGMLVAGLAALVNLTVARSMLAAAKRFDSITLEADARHLLTDVWTSAGMIAGLSCLLFLPPSWAVLDPIIGLAMAGNICFTGFSLLRRSAHALLDRALPEEEIARIEEAIRRHAEAGSRFHGLRTRKAGRERFADFHLLVPGDMSVQQSHDLCCAIENDLHAALPGLHVTIHVEPLEDAASWDGKRVGGRGGSCPGPDGTCSSPPPA